MKKRNQNKGNYHEKYVFPRLTKQALAFWKNPDVENDESLIHRSFCIFRKVFCVQGIRSISTLLAFYGTATFGYLRAPVGLHKNHALPFAT